jgi:Spy/CpxP family protein refolding chaperone
MTRTKVILLLSFLLVFAAGISLGVLLTRWGRHGRPRSWLTTELNLTRDQQDQMRKIWSEVMGASSRQHAERRSALMQQRDQAILALLSETQRQDYEAIQQDYARKMDELAAEMKQAFDEAVGRTRRLLSPEQAAKYDALMARQRERPMEGGPGPMGFRGPRHHRATSTSTPTTNERREPHGGD